MPDPYEIRILRKRWEHDDQSAQLAFCCSICTTVLLDDTDVVPNNDCPQEIRGATLELDRKKRVTVLGKDRADLLMSYLRTIYKFDGRYVVCRKKE